MKSQKIVTPVLLFLVIILLMIAVYFNFVFKPLAAKVAALSLENELIKNQRMEIEFAIINEENILKDIVTSKAKLEENKEFELIDGSLLVDDIYANAKIIGINLVDIVIGDPDFADETDDSNPALLSLPATLNYTATYDETVRFINSLETSNIGAYRVDLLNGTVWENGLLRWQLILRLYYYGDPQTVPITVEEDKEIGIGDMNWAQ